MPSLQDIAKQISSLAQLNLQRKPTRAIKTGNLLRKVKDANTPAKMVKEIKTKDSYSFEIELDYAPQGAEYGKFVNDGTSKMKARPFADNALNDPTVEAMLNQYYEDMVDKLIVGNIAKELDEMEAEY
jgi:HK97 gp10 family phage protein